MKIVEAKVFVCAPGRNFVTLRIRTDEGITGIGDATLNGRELAVASYLTDHVMPCLIGRDPFQTEDIWQYLYRGAYWRRGPVTMTAISAVDVALWDIKGKALKTPLYNLLGGRSRTGVMVYGHANGRDIEEASDAVARHRDQGFLAVRAQCGVPGLPTTYGVAKSDAVPYEPAEKGLPHEHVWSSEKYLVHVPQLFETLRVRFGSDLHLLHDAHHRLTPIQAARLGKALEPYHLFWLEDPTPAELQEGFRIIRQHTTTPIAVGEVFDSIWDAKQLISEQLIDYLRMTVAARRWSDAAEEDRGICGHVSRAHRLSWRDGSLADCDGGGAALRYGHSEFRHPGIHAAHGRDRRRLSARVYVSRRLSGSGRCAGPRRGVRRSAGGEVSLRTRVSAGEPQARRHALELVIE